jgi:hypothetical protein
MNELNALINDITINYSELAITICSIAACVAGWYTAAVAWKVTGEKND